MRERIENACFFFSIKNTGGTLCQSGNPQKKELRKVRRKTPIFRKKGAAKSSKGNTNFPQKRSCKKFEGKNTKKTVSGKHQKDGLGETQRDIDFRTLAGGPE